MNTQPVLMPIFAEIGDHEPMLAAVWCLGLFLCGLVLFAAVGIRKPWGILAAAVIAALSAFATVNWVRDPSVAEGIGRPYIRDTSVAGCLPCAFVVAGLLARHGKLVAAAYLIAVILTFAALSQTFIYKWVPPIRLALWYPSLFIFGWFDGISVLLVLTQFAVFAAAFQHGIKRWPVWSVVAGLILIYVAMAGMALAIVKIASGR